MTLDAIMPSALVPTAALAGGAAALQVPPAAFTNSRHFPAWIAE